MPRVSILVPGLDRGGMTRAYSLAASLEAAGAGVEIVGALPAGARIYPTPPSGLSVVPVHAGSFARRVRETAQVARGDILYAVKPRVTSFGVALLIRNRRRVWVDIDDFEAVLAADARQPESPLRRARKSMARARNLDRPGYTRWMERWLPRADAVTANSRFLTERYRATFVPSVRDLGAFDPARFDADACRHALGLGGSRVVMFPGTVRAHKGVEDAAAALDLLDWPDARLVLVGGRDAGDDLAAALAARWPARVLRLPRFGAGEMPSVLAAAHAVVVPQRDTPAARAQFPMKLTDAMAMAKPIVASRVGDIPDVLDGAAWLVPPSSPADIASALTEIFTSPAEAALRGERARRVCDERFSPRAAAACLAPLLA